MTATGAIARAMSGWLEIQHGGHRNLRLSCEELPVVVAGTVAAGEPILADERVEVWISRAAAETFRPPTDWYGVFARNPDCYVVLHLRDGRRLYGWPSQWPGSEHERLFVIEGPQWLGEGKETIDAGQALVAQAEDVEMVEFVNALPEETT